MPLDSTMVTDLTNKLDADVKRFIDTYQSRHDTDWLASNALLGAALIVAAAVVIAGLYEQAKIAAIFGLASATLISADRMWPVGEKAQFFRELVTEAENLQIDMRSIGSDPDKYAKAVSVFVVLKTNAAKQIPKGEGMSAIKQFTNELNAAKK